MPEERPEPGTGEGWSGLWAVGPEVRDADRGPPPVVCPWGLSDGWWLPGYPDPSPAPPEVPFTQGRKPLIDGRYESVSAPPDILWPLPKWDPGGPPPCRWCDPLVVKGDPPSDPPRPGGELPEVATSAMLQMRGLELAFPVAFIHEDCWLLEPPEGWGRGSPGSTALVSRSDSGPPPSPWSSTSTFRSDRSSPSSPHTFRSWSRPKRGKRERRAPRSHHWVNKIWGPRARRDMETLLGPARLI